MKSLISIFVLIFFVSSCALDRRDYENEMVYQSSDPMFIPGEDFEITSGDTGKAYRNYREVFSRTPLSDKEVEIYQQRDSLSYDLADKRSQLTQVELKQYNSVESIFSNESEKIYFLSLSPFEKQSFLELKGALSPISKSDQARAIASVAKSSEQGLAMGMAMHEVLVNIGAPSKKEILGESGAEKWSYPNQAPSCVYFNNGFVKSWE